MGEAVLDAHPDVDLIICNAPPLCPASSRPPENKGLTKDDVTITGFATPNAIKAYCTNGTLYNWGLWDCGIQGAMGCYVAAYIAAGNDVKVGDKTRHPRHRLLRGSGQQLPESRRRHRRHQQRRCPAA